MNAKVEVYCGTGFDNVNLPKSFTLLENESNKLVYTNFRLTTFTDLKYIRINETYSNIADADFVRISFSGDYTLRQDRVYFVTGINMLSENTAELLLELSGYLTWKNWAYNGHISITATRLTPIHSLTESNTLAETFTPAYPETYTTMEQNFQPEQTDEYKDLQIIGATVDIEKITNTAAAFTNANGEEVLYLPKLPIISQGTELKMLGQQSASYELPGEMLFENDLNKGTVSSNWIFALQNLQSLGISDVIMDRYILPGTWGYIVNGASTTSNKIHTLAGRTKYGWYDLTDTLSNLAKKYNFNNLKSIKLFSRVLILSRLTGDSATFNFAEIENSAKHAAIEAFSDPSPQGRPYCRPSVYHSNEALPINFQTVQGATWYKPQMIIGGAEGSLIRRYETQRTAADIARSRAQTLENERLRGYGLAGDLLGNIAGLAGGIATGNAGTTISSITGIINTGINAEKYNIDKSFSAAWNIDKRNDLMTELNIANSIYTPELKTAEGNNFALISPNSFMILGINLDLEDIKRFDKMLTKYGYSIPPTVIDLSSAADRGKYFSYIEAGNIELLSNTTPERAGHGFLPLYIRNKITAELQNGIRVWKVRPDSKYYSLCNDPRAEEE